MKPGDELPIEVKNQILNCWEEDLRYYLSGTHRLRYQTNCVWLIAFDPTTKLFCGYNTRITPLLNIGDFCCPAYWAPTSYQVKEIIQAFHNKHWGDEKPIVTAPMPA